MGGLAWMEACGSAAGQGGEVRVGDYFAGIGAMRLGFDRACEATGLTARCVGFSEIDAAATRTYLRHFGGTPSLGDIRSLAINGQAPACDVLLAGFPCPAFSIAGRRLGFEDWRGRLFWDLAAVIKAARPSAFLLENVKGLVSHDGGQTLKIVLETLGGLGYEVHHAVLNARHFGVPQNRERIYIVGFLGNGRNFRFPPPTDPSRTLREVLETEPVSAKYYVAEDALAAMRHRKARHESKGNGFGYRVLDPDGVSHALVRGGSGRETNFVVDPRLTVFEAKGKRSPINREMIRHTTPQEWERLQGLPTAWTAGNCDTDRYGQLGNAVAVPVIRAIGEAMLSPMAE